MKREYHKWYSERLGRDMELLVFGHDGLPAIVFPTSQGRFFEFEDRGMVEALRDKIDGGRLQLICVDSVDAESWYNRGVGADWQIARHIQYENYVLNEVLPLLRRMNGNPHLASLGCSFGGYHALNIALRHPHLFTGCLSMGGAFDLKSLGFLRGFYNDDAYYNLPLDYVPGIHDHEYLERLRQNTYVLATGVNDQCWNDNERMAAAMRNKGIPVRLEVWGDNTGHDWPWWQRMAQNYL
jgi:esterase/lipase superfamily enzyme